jgi:hypothetical protein
MVLVLIYYWKNLTGESWHQVNAQRTIAHQVNAQRATAHHVNTQRIFSKQVNTYRITAQRKTEHRTIAHKFRNIDFLRDWYFLGNN